MLLVSESAEAEKFSCKCLIVICVATISKLYENAGKKLIGGIPKNFETKKTHRMCKRRGELKKCPPELQGSERIEFELQSQWESVLVI